MKRNASWLKGSRGSGARVSRGILTLSTAKGRMTALREMKVNRFCVAQKRLDLHKDWCALEESETLESRDHCSVVNRGWANSRDVGGAALIFVQEERRSV